MKLNQLSKKFILKSFRPYHFIILFIAGVALCETVSNTLALIIGANLIIIGLLFLIFLRSKTVLALFGVFVLGLIYFETFQAATLKNIEPKCQIVSIKSAVKVSSGSLEFAVIDKSGGRAVLQVKKARPVGYNDKIRICPNLAKPVATSGGFKRYLLSKYKSSDLYSLDEIEFIQAGGGALRKLFSFSASIGDICQKLFPGDIGVLAKGLLIGQTDAFSGAFKKLMRSSGTTHLVAVSGYNVSIIAISLFGFIRSLISRRAAVAVSLCVLVLFCLLTGATASVLRATIMGAILILGKIIGRRSAGINALFVAALLMILFNPFSLWDAGFQLSFAATMGLVMSEPIVKPVLALIKNAVALNFAKAFGETIFAQIFTLPILLIGFGNFSWIAPLANLLILPFVPVAMSFLAITVSAYFIYPIFGIFVAGATELLLRYFTSVILVFGSWRFSALSLKDLSWLWTIPSYALIASAFVLLKSFVKKHFKDKFYG